MLVTNRYFLTIKNGGQQQARAPENKYIPKWKYFPNWDIIIQTHPLQSISPHLLWHVDKRPIYVIKYPEPKYIFCLPKNAPRCAQKHETVSKHPSSAVSHVVYKCHRSCPTVLHLSTTLPSHPAPSASDLPYPPT